MEARQGCGGEHTLSLKCPLDVKSLCSVADLQVNTYGQKFEGVWNEGKKEGEFIATFKDGFSERRMYKDGFQTALLGSTAPGGVEVPAPPSRFR